MSITVNKITDYIEFEPLASSPGNAPTGKARIYLDSGSNSIQISTNGGGYTATLPNTLSVVLGAGNTTGPNNIQITSGQVLQFSTDAGISRVAAAILALGNGSAADASGTLRITNIQAPSATALNLGGGTSNQMVLSGSTSGGTTAALTQPVNTSGSPTLLTVTGGAHTTLTASTEASDINLNLARTVQFSTGALTTQRAAVVQAPTYAFVAASTITNAATLAISGAPVAGTNATITNAYALWVQAGLTRLGDSISLAGTFTKYSDIATAGWGVPAIYGYGRLTAQTAAAASVATYTVGASDGSFLVSGNVNVSSSTGGTNFNLQVSYTDENNVAQTSTFQVHGAGTTYTTSINSNNTFEAQPLHIRCKAGTSITILTSGAFGTTSYNVEGIIQQIA